MKLRDHPLMSYYGHHNWPPVWISLHEREDRISRNEVGVLTEVRKSEIRTDGIVLIMKYNESFYWTILTFPDMAFFNEMFYLMRKSIGQNIQNIGDIDLRHAL
jgi:hypothetical protein